VTQQHRVLCVGDPLHPLHGCESATLPLSELPGRRSAAFTPLQCPAAREVSKQPGPQDCSVSLMSGECRTPHSARRIGMSVLSAKNRLHGYIAVHQQLSRLQTGYTPVTRLHRCPSAT